MKASDVALDLCSQVGEGCGGERMLLGRVGKGEPGKVVSGAGVVLFPTESSS